MTDDPAAVAALLAAALTTAERQEAQIRSATQS